jgi:hypothetical protein
MVKLLLLVALATTSITTDAHAFDFGFAKKWFDSEEEKPGKTPIKKETKKKVEKKAKKEVKAKTSEETVVTPPATDAATSPILEGKETYTDDKGRVRFRSTKPNTSNRRNPAAMIRDRKENPPSSEGFNPLDLPAPPEGLSAE